MLENMYMECRMKTGKENTKNNYEKKRVLYWRIRKIIWRKDEIPAVPEILHGWVNCADVFSSYSNVFCFKINKIFFMKINAVRVMIISSLVIIVLYTLGLFLPIIKNTKDSKIDSIFKNNVVTFL